MGKLIHLLFSIVIPLLRGDMKYDFEIEEKIFRQLKLSNC